MTRENGNGSGKFTVNQHPGLVRRSGNLNCGDDMSFNFKRMGWKPRRKKCYSCNEVINTGDLVFPFGEVIKGKTKLFFFCKDCVIKHHSKLNSDKPKPETIQKRFIRFLKEEGVFDQYVKNWDNTGRLHRHRPIKDKCYYISMAFYWDHSETGHEFWLYYSHKWIEITEKERW